MCLTLKFDMSFVLLCPLPPTLWLLLARLLLYSILQQNESCKIDPIFLLQKVVNVLSPPRKYFIMKKYYSSDPRAKATIIGNRDVTCKKSTSIESRRLWMLTQIHLASHKRQPTPQFEGIAGKQFVPPPNLLIL